MKVASLAASGILCLLALTSCNTGTDPSSDSSSPILSVNPSSLDFRGTEALKTLDIVNDGGGALTWVIDTNTGWIVCPVSSGETETSTTLEISVNGKEIDDPDQISEGTLTIFSNGGNYSVSVFYIPGFTLTGFVYDREVPRSISLSDATVTLYSGDLTFSTTTDQDDWYNLEDMPKSFDYVEVLKEGYIPSGIPPGIKLVIPDNNILEYDFYLIPDTEN